MLGLWIIFFALVLALLALDLGVFHKDAHSITLRAAIGWTIVWVSVGLCFSIAVYFIYEHNWFGAAELARSGEPVSGGGDAVILYITGYLLEKSLSIDNIFVIALLMRTLSVPAQYQHRVLFWGIVGALVLRGSMIAGGVWLLQHVTWAFYVFGGILVLSGLRMLLAKESEETQINWFTKLITRVLPVSSAPANGRFMTRENGKRVFTSLFVALLAIELTDVIFAVDSIPAILAVTTDPFLVVTSNVFAIMGLRSLYFVLAGMMDVFHHLKSALAVLLIGIGAKMIGHDFFKIPNLVSLAIIIGIVATGVLASLVWPSSSESETE